MTSMRLAELSTVTLTLLAAGGLPWLFACASAPPAVPLAASTPGGEAGAGAAAGSPAEADVHSFARPWEVAVEHLALDLSVDFEARRLAGRASLRLRQRSGAGA